MRQRVSAVRDKGKLSERAAADAILKAPGDAGIIIRPGVPRLLIMRCPSGCGEQIVLNLDTRVGKAWRMHLRSNKLSVMPSVWRDSGCFSHFVVWHSKIWWVDDRPRQPQSSIREQIMLLMARRSKPLSYIQIARQLDASVGDVVDALLVLANREHVKECEDKDGFFYID